MSIFIDNKKIIDENDWKNTSIGRNLLIDSQTFSDFTFYGTTAKPSQDNVVIIGNSGRANSVQRENLALNTLFSWSIYAKADSNDVVLHTELNGGGGNTDQTVTQEWKRYSFHGMSNSKGVLFFWKASGSGKLYLKLPKLEYGSIATKWSPAPEDYAMQSDVIKLQDQINQLKSKLGG